MEHISSPSQIKEIMSAHGLIFHKGLGQNFLFDAHFLDQIVGAAELTKDDTVLHWGEGQTRMDIPDMEKLDEIMRTVKPVGE